jgi:amino acid transporter
MKTEAGGLRRELKVWEALALSVGLMSPALAMSAAGGGAAALVGRNVPLAFLGAGVVIALVAYGFIYLSRRYVHAGSVYGLAGVTLGPRAGFVSGWALLLTYAAFTPASAFAFGAFFAQFCDTSGLWPNASYLPFSVAALMLVWLFTAGDIRKLSRGLLGMEGASVLLILALMATVVYKIATGSAPDHQTLSLSVFVPSGDVDFHSLSLGVIFGFLAFAGFEAAASLGEETENPRQSIPRAIKVTVIAGIIFYVACMTVQSWGFGATEAGAAQFAASPGPLFEIGQNYLGTGLAAVLELGAAVSAFGSALGSAAGGARLLFALSRDGVPGSPLTKISPRTGAPVVAVATLMTIALIVLGAVASTRPDPLTAWGWVGTVGVLAILVAYLMVNIGALRQMLRDEERRSWVKIVPILAAVALLWIMYSQIYPVPDAPFTYFPYVVAAWLAIGIALALLAPGLAERLGRGLAREEGLEIDHLGSQSVAAAKQSDIVAGGADIEVPPGTAT